MEPALHEKYLYREDLSRKGAKAQSAAAFLKGFLCAFAPLREKYFFPPNAMRTFHAKPIEPGKGVRKPPNPFRFALQFQKLCPRGLAMLEPRAEITPLAYSSKLQTEALPKFRISIDDSENSDILSTLRSILH